MPELRAEVPQQQAPDRAPDPGTQRTLGWLKTALVVNIVLTVINLFYLWQISLTVRGKL